MKVFRYIFLSVFFLWESYAFSQLRIGALEELNGDVKNVLVTDSNTFVLVTTEFQGVKTYHTLRSYSGLTLMGTQRLPDEHNGKTMYYKAFEVLNDTLSGFFCVANTETFDYYLQRFDSLCFPVNNPELVASISRFSNKNWENGNVLISPDKSRYLIYCGVSDQVSNTESFYFMQFSASSNQLLSKKEIPGVKSADDISFEDVWLTNKGKVIVSEYVFFEKQVSQRKRNRRMEVIRLHTFDIGIQTPGIITLMPPDNEYLTHVECTIGDNSVSGVGVYCKENDHFNGLFSFSTGDTLSSTVMVKTLPRMQSVDLSGFDLRFSNRHDLPAQCRKYVCHDMKFLQTFYYGDTSVYIWERIATMVHHDEESYLSTDILVSKVYEDSIISCKVIPKSTVSTFYNGKNVKAHIRQSGENELIIYFNDYVDLYSASGEYLSESPKLKRDRIIKPPLGVVEIRYNLTNESCQRKMLFDNTVFEVPATPVLWKNAGEKTLLLQFATYGKFRFAYWKY